VKRKGGKDAVKPPTELQNENKRKRQEEARRTTTQRFFDDAPQNALFWIWMIFFSQRYLGRRCLRLSKEL